LPATDEGFVSVSVELENGASRSATDAVVNQIEEELKKEEDIDVYVSLIGTTQQGQSQGTSATNTAEIYVKMIPLDERDRSVFDFVDEVQPRVLDTIGEQAEVSFNLQTAAGSTPNSLTFTVTDTDKARLDEAISRLSEEIRELPDVTELTSDREETIDELQMVINKEAATEYGLAPVQIAQTANNTTRGVQASQILAENDEVYSVFVKFDDEYKNSVEKLRTLKLRTP